MAGGAGGLGWATRGLREGEGNQGVLTTHLIVCMAESYRGGLVEGVGVRAVGEQCFGERVSDERVFEMGPSWLWLVGGGS